MTVQLLFPKMPHASHTAGRRAWSYHTACDCSVGLCMGECHALICVWGIGLSNLRYYAEHISPLWDCQRWLRATDLCWNACEEVGTLLYLFWDCLCVKFFCFYSTRFFFPLYQFRAKGLVMLCINNINQFWEMNNSQWLASRSRKGKLACHWGYWSENNKGETATLQKEFDCWLPCILKQVLDWLNLIVFDLLIIL